MAVKSKVGKTELDETFRIMGRLAAMPHRPHAPKKKAKKAKAKSAK